MKAIKVIKETVPGCSARLMMALVLTMFFVDSFSLNSYADDAKDLTAMKSDSLGIERHKAPITSLAINHSDTIVATGDSEGRIILWDIVKGKVLHVLSGGSSVNVVAFNPKEDILVSGHGTGMVRFWNVNSGKEIQSRKAYNMKEVKTMSFSPDGKRLAIGGDDTQIQIWEVNSGEKIKTLIKTGREVSAVAYSPDGTKIAAGGDGDLQIWDSSTGLEVRKFKGHTWIRSIGFKPDGSMIASGDNDGIKVWSLSENIEVFHFKTEAPVNSVAFSNNGSSIVSGDGICSLWSCYGEIKLWSLDSEKSTRSFYRSEVWSVDAVSLSSSGQYLIGSTGKTFRIWEVDTENKPDPNIISPVFSGALHDTAKNGDIDPDIDSDDASKVAYRLYEAGQAFSQYGGNGGQAALDYFERSLKICRSMNLPECISANLNMIGLVYHALGQYDKALVNYDESLKIKKQLNIPESIATSLNNFGGVYESLGQYDKALSYHEESLKIRKQLNIPQDIAISLNNIGLVYGALGQYDKALSYHEESLKIRKQLNDQQDIAISLNNIGLVYDGLGQYDMALSYFEESLKISRKLKISQDITTSLNNIGGVYFDLKKYKEAEKIFLGTEKEGDRYEAGLIDVYIATGRYNEALKLLKDMTPRWNHDDPYRIYFHTVNGFALKGMGNIKDASAELLRAFSLTEEMRQEVKGEKVGFLGGGYAGGRVKAYRGLVSALSERAIKGETKDENFIPYGKDLLSSAFYFAESTKARVLLEAMAASAKKTQIFEIPEQLREKEQSILNQLSAIESQWEDAYKKGEDVLKRLKERKEGLKRELDILINKLRGKYPRYAALNYPKPIPPEDLPLKNDEVLLEYALDDDAGYIFVIRKGGVKNLLKMPIGRDVLEEKIKTFVEPMNTKQIEIFSVSKANELYDILLSDALKGVKENEKIIIVPDGILSLLPFEALATKQGSNVNDTSYVGDKYRIRYYQAATVLALQRNIKDVKREKVLFALGNPVYDKEDPRYIAWKSKSKDLLVASANKYSFRGLAIKSKWGKTTEADTINNKVTFPPLPETETEVREIAKTMGMAPEPPDVLLSMMANETWMRKAGLDKYRYIHFATHASLPGMIQGLNEPFILLGQVENMDKDDGFLTLSEVLELRLNADMVVLSACVTGVGKEVEGEGVANFARAFQYAGAKSVVVSLWNVASNPAVEYMKKFYGFLKEGQDRGEALRLTRKEMKEKYPNPFYWAVFILHGEG